MMKNELKVVCNQKTNTASFYMKNEQNAWVRLSPYSELSKVEYASKSIAGKVNGILDIISTTYNPSNRGVLITVEGSATIGNEFRSAIKSKFTGKNISINTAQVKVGVAGKIGAGKTDLIEGIGKAQGLSLTIEKRGKYLIYKDAKSVEEWYELKGIDFGLNSVDATEKTVKELVNQGLSVLLYCLGSNRVEEPERDLIKRISESCPQISIIAILTNAISEDDSISAASVSKILGVSTIPVMAKERKTRGGVISPFGLDQVIHSIFEDR